MFAVIFGISGAILSGIMMMHMAFDWHYYGLAGVFAALGIMFLTILMEVSR